MPLPFPEQRGKNIIDTLGLALCDTFFFSPYFDVICDLLLNRRRASWNIFVELISSCQLLSTSSFFPLYRSYLNQADILKPLLNPMYEPNNSVLWPSVASQSLVSPQILLKVITLKEKNVCETIEY